MNVEFDLKEILVRLETKIDKLSEDVGDLKINLIRVETELKGEIKVLDEKIDGVSKSLNEKIDGASKSLNEKIDEIVKRIDTQEFINRGVIIGLILAILGGFAKVFGLVPPSR